jgi:DNA-binding NarL/FixJ family response regulator
MPSAPRLLAVLTPCSVLREGLKDYLSLRGERAVLWATCREAEAMRRMRGPEETPDVLLVDERLSGAAPARTIARLRPSGARCRIVIFSTCPSVLGARAATDAGADGYLKLDDLDALSRSVDTLLNGR